MTCLHKRCIFITNHAMLSLLHLYGEKLTTQTSNIPAILGRFNNDVASLHHTAVNYRFPESDLFTISEKEPSPDIVVGRWNENISPIRSGLSMILCKSSIFLDFSSLPIVQIQNIIVQWLQKLPPFRKSMNALSQSTLLFPASDDETSLVKEGLCFVRSVRAHSR